MANAAVVKKVLDRLRGALGTGETPPGSNHNFITTWYNQNVAKIGDGPWCEMTNTWSCWTGGAKEIKRGRAYTVWAAGDGVNKVNGSSFHYGTKGLRAGDHVYFDWKGGRNSTAIIDHTGTVEKINGNGTFYTLEGNTNGNVLKRQLRDGKYVVGYVRLDWDKITPEPAKPAPPAAKPKPSVAPDRVMTKAVQRVLRVSADGEWGSKTDAAAKLMRIAAKATVGSPKRVAAKYDVKAVQRIIGTTPDGKWDSKDQNAIAMWVKTFQQAVKSEVGGHWGPKTDNKFLAVRKQNLNNF